MLQIELAQIWPVVTVIAIPSIIYFVKLEIRVRKVEELEHKLALESRIKKLESDPVFKALSQMTPSEAVDLYRDAKEKTNESK